MTLTPDDPRLSAYVLGELSPEEAAWVARAAAADPALARELRAFQEVRGKLAASFEAARASDGLLPHQRASVLAAARMGKRPAAVRGPARPAWLIPTAAAAVITAGTLAVLALRDSASSLTLRQNHRDGAATQTASQELPIGIALLPAPGPVNPDPFPGTASAPDPALAKEVAERDHALSTTGDAFLAKMAARLKQIPAPPPNALPRLQPRDAVLASSHPALDIPVLSGRSSLQWIANSIRSEKKTPEPGSVRLEEVLNAFTFRPSGVAAVNRGVTLYAEPLPCPWKPSSTLFLVSLRGATDGDRKVRVTFHADPSATARYRLLGFASLAGVKSGPLPTLLPAKSNTAVAVEIEPIALAGRLGSIEWSVDGEASGSVPVNRHSPDAEPSDDARFASLVCAYAQWLVRDQPELIDGPLVDALAKENASPKLTADRRDFLSLVHETRTLSERKKK